MKEGKKSREQRAAELAGVGRKLDDLGKSESDERYRRIMDTADEGIWVLDESYVTTFVNKRMADMLLYTPEEMVGKRHDEFLFGEDFQDLEEKTSMRRHGLPGRYERRLKRKDGATVWAHVSASPILDGDGAFQGSLAMFTDITGEKEAARALKRSEEKYRSIFENAVEGVFQSTPGGRLITVNPAMARMFGYASPDDMVSGVTSIGQQIYTNAEDRRTFTRLLETDGVVRGFEARFYRKDRTVMWGSLNVRAVKAKDGGEVLYYEGILEDITSRKDAEEALRKSEEKYRNIFENAAEGIYQVTPGGKYLSVNPALARIHGFDSPEEMMASVTDVAHQLYVDPARRALLKRLVEEEGAVKDFEIMMRRKDGSLHWVSNSAHAVRDREGKLLYWEGTVEDITTRKLAEEESKQLKATLDGVLEAMSSFVEIRDPGTKGHQMRVARLAVAMSREMGFSAEMVENIRMAAMIHDLGMMSVPAEILNRPALLTVTERNLIKVHPQSGFKIIKDAGLPHPIPDVILQHHERLDGSGYPLGLRGKEILLEASILAVADVVEAMAAPRPYRQALGIGHALKEIEAGSGTIFNEEAVRVCVMLFREKGFAFS